MSSLVTIPCGLKQVAIVSVIDINA